MAEAVALAVSGVAPGPEWLRLPGGRQVALGWCGVGEAQARELLPAEQEALERCRTEKRRAELMAGRVAARRALARLRPGWSAQVVARQGGPDSGRPCFLEAPGLALSISHAAGLAVAAVAAGGPLGVDLERRVEASAGFVEEAFAHGELERWQAVCAGWVDAPTAAWAMKEAVLKVWGVGLRAPLQRVAVRPVLLRAEPGQGALALAVEAGAVPAGLGPVPVRLAGVLWTVGPGQVLALAG